MNDGPRRPADFAVRDFDGRSQETSNRNLKSPRSKRRRPEPH